MSKIELTWKDLSIKIEIESDYSIDVVKEALELTDMLHHNTIMYYRDVASIDSKLLPNIPQ